MRHVIACGHDLEELDLGSVIGTALALGVSSGTGALAYDGSAASNCHQRGLTVALLTVRAMRQMAS